MLIARARAARCRRLRSPVVPVPPRWSACISPCCQVQPMSFYMALVVHQWLAPACYQAQPWLLRLTASSHRLPRPMATPIATWACPRRSGCWQALGRFRALALAVARRRLRQHPTRQLPEARETCGSTRISRLFWTMRRAPLSVPRQRLPVHVGAAPRWMNWPVLCASATSPDRCSLLTAVQPEARHGSPPWDRFGSGSASSRERFDGLRHKAQPRSLTWRQALPGAASARPTVLHRGRSWIAVNRLRQEEQIQIH